MMATEIALVPALAYALYMQLTGFKGTTIADTIQGAAMYFLFISAVLLTRTMPIALPVARARRL